MVVETVENIQNRDKGIHKDMEIDPLRRQDTDENIRNTVNDCGINFENKNYVDCHDTFQDFVQTSCIEMDIFQFLFLDLKKLIKSMVAVTYESLPNVFQLLGFSPGRLKRPLN